MSKRFHMKFFENDVILLKLLQAASKVICFSHNSFETSHSFHQNPSVVSIKCLCVLFVCLAIAAFKLWP